MKARLVLLLLAAALAALAVAGCGGGDSGGGSEDPASVAPADAPLFIEFAIQPEGELKSNIQALAKNLAGIDDPGAMIVELLESEATDSGEEFDFEKEVEPWLGEKGGMFFGRFDGEDFQGYGIAVEATDTDAAQQFIDDQIVGGDDPTESGSYEGVDFTVETDDGTTVGLIDDLFVFAETEKGFEEAVDASSGDSLGEAESFTAAIAAAPGNSFADIFIDVGRLIEQSGDEIDPDAKQLFETTGIDPSEMTATTSLVPGADQLEIDISSDLGGVEPPSGDASELLGSLPRASIAAFASAGFGQQLEEGIDSLDKSGIPGEIPPNQLKKTMAAAGIDLDKIAGSLEDAALFVQGANESSLGGALVFTAKGNEATNTVSNIGLFLRAADVPGVTAIKGGGGAGFSIRDAELGRQPLVVAAKDERIAIAYGAKAAAQALDSTQNSSLADNDTYKAAVSSLGGTPISGFADGAGVLKLVESMLDGEDRAELQEARPYLQKARFLAVGAGSSDGVATAKLILGFNE
ncbi:MAG TPA: DUF3352 domain-containing protein [Solirubrobacterales bacterium]|nr:DUF3352 domain-containing protein [Solirubrobacterales bacterium]